MKYVKQTHARVVAANTPEEFEMKLNKTLADIALAGSEPTIQFNCNVGFCAYITHETTTRVPENIEDEYELKGIRFTCGECPNWIQPIDGRVKYSHCDVIGCNRKSSDSACEWLYREDAKHISTGDGDEEARVA